MEFDDDDRLVLAMLATRWPTILHRLSVEQKQVLLADFRLMVEEDMAGDFEQGAIEYHRRIGPNLTEYIRVLMIPPRRPQS